MIRKYRYLLTAAAAVGAAGLLTFAARNDFGLGRNMEIAVNMMRELSLNYVDPVDPDRLMEGAAAQCLAQFLPEGPQLFPEDMVTDQPERQVCAEIIREKLLLCLDKEIPHGTAVEITTFSERDDGIIDLDATIYCEKASHKGIIIGKGGAMLKKISTLARTDIEAFMGTKVFLQTWVKVKENWRDNMNLIKNFGYRDE